MSLDKYLQRMKEILLRIGRISSTMLEYSLNIILGGIQTSKRGKAKNNYTKFSGDNREMCVGVGRPGNSLSKSNRRRTLTS